MNVERKVWVLVTEKGKVRDCAVDRYALDVNADDDKIVRGTVTVDVPEKKKAKGKK